MRLLLIAAALSLASMCSAQTCNHNASLHKEKPCTDAHPCKVPDEQTALRIGESILDGVYGKKHIDRGKPLTATLERGVWRVAGTLPRGWIGGVADVRIAKYDGRILSVCHGK